VTTKNNVILTSTISVVMILMIGAVTEVNAQNATLNQTQQSNQTGGFGYAYGQLIAKRIMELEGFHTSYNGTHCVIHNTIFGNITQYILNQRTQIAILQHNITKAHGPLDRMKMENRVFCNATTGVK
jgi:hypothetical protein